MPTDQRSKRHPVEPATTSVRPRATEMALKVSNAEPAYWSVVISRLQEVDPRLPDEIDQSVFLCDSPRPAALEVELERFRLADATSRVSKDSLHEIEHTQSCLSIGLDPVAEIFPELGLEDCDPIREFGLSRTHSEMASARPRSRLRSSSEAGVPSPSSARSSAAAKRLAFRGERNRWAVSRRDSSSASAMIATFS